MSTTELELTMGERLLTWRRRRGLQLRDVASQAEEMLPLSMSISRETIRRLEVGMISEAKANPVHLAALAQVYGVAVRDISPAAADALDEVRGLLARSSPWITAGGGLDVDLEELAAALERAGARSDAAGVLTAA